MSNKQRIRLRIRSLVVVAAAIALAVHIAPSSAQLAPPACPQTSTATSWSGAFLNADTTKAGVIFNPTSNLLELPRSGQAFATTPFTSLSDTVYVAPADFDRDGWIDFVGIPQGLTTTVGNTNVSVFRNFTFQNENCTDFTCTTYAGAQPDFNDPAVVITPKFTNVRTLDAFPQPTNIISAANVGTAGRFSIAAADFNGDGWPDLFLGLAPVDVNGGVRHQFTKVRMYLNSATNDVSHNPQFATGYDAATFTITSTLGVQSFSGTNTQAVDWNKDGRMDILLSSTSNNGAIHILLNNCPGTVQGNGVVLCSANPTFTDGGFLIKNLNATVGNEGFGITNPPPGMAVFAYNDFDGDTLPDLIVGAPNCCTTATNRAKLYKGCSGGGGCSNGIETTASQSLTFFGGLTNIPVADLSGDGKPDVVLAITGNAASFSGGARGGESYYYQNNGTSTPFSAAPTQLTIRGTGSGQVQSFNMGAAFDYDNDTNHTNDVLLANGNTANGYNLVANRISNVFSGCGDVISGLLPATDFGSNTEKVVTSARLTPNIDLSGGGTIDFYMSNETPANWVLASPCVTAPTTDYCATFPKPVGADVRWKAHICPNGTNTGTPKLVSVDAKASFTPAKEFYRAGTIVSDSIVYVGAFSQPGDRGRFYALDATLTQSYWNASAKLDAMADGSRNIYTVAAGSNTRLDFTTANAANTTLQSLLGTPDATATSTLITWARSARFGAGTAVAPLQRLGSIITSTPAIVVKPGLPPYFAFADATDRSNIQTFVAANSTRTPLVLVGAKDGMVHAFATNPADGAGYSGDTANGVEAWAFIPPTVASGMLADKTATEAANAALNNGTNNPTIASYPDGSPTIGDAHLTGTTFKTLAIVAEGNGGKSITAMDVTSTVDPATGVVNGPTPMWSATPGDGEAGQAFSKPAMARVLIGGVERWLVIAGTGIDFNDTLDQKGRIVSAYDAFTGTLMWKFQAKCPVTTDISVFETDDLGEPGAPTLNGYVDRAVFADKCGYVYKVAPGIDNAGKFLDNTGFGSILANTTSNGVPQFAIFSTHFTTGALNADRPIGGTIGARTDATTRVVMFFGTGGLEQVSPTLTNEFYAVYADTGVIRSKITGACGVNGCEKFYGGVLATPQRVLFTRTVDPNPAASCDFGSSELDAVALDADSSGNFVNQLTQAIGGAVMGGLYGDAGAVYFATLKGDVERIGQPDTTKGVYTGGQQTGTGDTNGGGTTEGFTLLGWRVVL